MNPEYKEKFNELSRLKLEKKALDARIDILSEEVTSIMVDNSVDKVETAMGNFSLRALKKWVFPETVLLLEEELKEKKKRAQQTGEATFTESYSLSFRGKDSPSDS